MENICDITGTSNIIELFSILNMLSDINIALGNIFLMLLLILMTLITTGSSSEHSFKTIIICVGL